MIDKEKRYDVSTKKVLKRVREIARDGFYAEYDLPAIAYEIRTLIKDEKFRKKFTEGRQEAWSKGFCALAAYTYYNLTGADSRWEYYVLSQQIWDKGPVVYLHNKLNDKYLYIGDLEQIPYHLGRPLNAQNLRCPNSAEFIEIVKSRLERK